MATLEIEMFDQAASVGPRAEMVVQGHVRAAGDWDGLYVAADTAIDKHRLALDLASIVTEETVFRLALVLIFRLRLHSSQPQ